MTDLHAYVVASDALTGSDRDAMFALMDLVYEGMARAVFEADLATKDTVIVLRAPDGTLAGFSTQRTMSVRVADSTAQGVFSGDTVINPAHWGSPALSPGILPPLHRRTRRALLVVPGQQGASYVPDS